MPRLGVEKGVNGSLGLGGKIPNFLTRRILDFVGLFEHLTSLNPLSFISSCLSCFGFGVILGETFFYVRKLVRLRRNLNL